MMKQATSVALIHIIHIVHVYIVSIIKVFISKAGYVRAHNTTVIDFELTAHRAHRARGESHGSVPWLPR